MATAVVPDDQMTAAVMFSRGAVRVNASGRELPGQAVDDARVGGRDGNGIQGRRGDGQGGAPCLASQSGGNGRNAGRNALVARPPEFTVATAVVPDAQITAAVMSWEVPSE